MPDDNAYSGIAALAICESLLLAIWDRGVLPESEIAGLLRDAAAAHENAAALDVEVEMHRAVADVINAIQVGDFTSRRS